MTTAAVFPSATARRPETIAPSSPRQLTKYQRSEIFDRRRRQGRDLAETLVARAEHLLPEDRALLNAIYRDGASAREIATLTGVSPKSVRLRIRKLAQRALDPRFAFVLVYQNNWAPTRRKVATEHVLHGLPLRETAKRLNLTLYTVRRHADAIRVMFEALGK